VRPFGAIVFGRIGDLVGRKYTFLVTILFMGGATFLVGLLPTYETIGWAAPILLVTLRLVQGLALGGEYGGAATYVAEHAPHGKRGYDTSWIQTTATLGFFLALSGDRDACRVYMDAKVFADWGWRVPFWLSLVLLIFSVYIRSEAARVAGLPEDEVEGRRLQVAASPTASCAIPNNKYVLLALLGATAGPGRRVVHGAVLRALLPHHHAQARLPHGVHVDGASLLLGTPFFIFFGWLSDSIGPAEDHPRRAASSPRSRTSRSSRASRTT
jgi:MFS family permease